MRNGKALLLFFLITFVFIAFFVFSCSKKEPGSPKPSQGKVELLPPKPPEPAKKDVEKIKDVPKEKDVEKQIIEKHKDKIVREKRVPAKKPESTATPPVPYTKMKKQPRVVDFNRLNREFSKYSLNVWASELKNNDILLNGYVKSENERKAALSIARQYNANITDMINTVNVHEIEGSENKGVQQRLPFGK